MPINSQKKILFVHIPRTGGSTIEKCFDMYRNPASLYGRKERNKKLYALQHLTLKEHINFGYVPRPKLYYKFAFVRNPWDRMVSAYSFHCKRKKRSEFNEFVRMASDYVFANKLKLSEKQYDILKRKYGISLLHIVPQINFIKYKHCDLDFIGRFENFEEDLQQVLDRYNMEVEIPKANKSNHDHYSKYYNDNLVGIVKRMYNEEIELFGYDFETA